MTGRRATPALLACVTALVCLAALAGCSRGRAASPAATSSGNDQAQALALGREFAQCARLHGRPNFPDPAIQDGALAFPGSTKEDQVAVQDACAPILQRMPASMRHGQPPSAQDMANLRHFAQCMRDNGIPEWPDPKPDGTFPIVGTPLEAEGKSQRVLGGMNACQQYAEGIDAS